MIKSNLDRTHAKVSRIEVLVIVDIRSIPLSRIPIRNIEIDIDHRNHVVVDRIHVHRQVKTTIDVTDRNVTRNPRATDDIHRRVQAEVRRVVIENEKSR